MKQVSMTIEGNEAAAILPDQRLRLREVVRSTERGTGDHGRRGRGGAHMEVRSAAGALVSPAGLDPAP